MTAPLRALLDREDRPAPPSAWSASRTLAWRAVLRIKHVPEQIFDATVLPVIMALMFTFLFGGAIAGSTGTYVQYLVPGILVTSVTMVTIYTGMGINNDIEKGVFDRIRSLPIWRPAPLVGAILGDVLRYVLTVVTIMVVGLLLGFRPGGGASGVLAAVALLLVFAFAFSWVWTMFGLLLRSEKSMMGVSMLVLFPLTFLSNVFVDPQTMPGWLRSFVTLNPITHLVTAVRSLCAGRPDPAAIGWVMLFAVLFIAVFGTVTMRLYQRR
ncbi:ABC transporter permease [Actinoplanes sp. NPDC023801]|uniref:ABC transporter permease n=1 Tax=Actinoplanes sp. NPDC023801 TaxID=3154595 RepID=UPI0033E916E2